MPDFTASGLSAAPMARDSSGAVACTVAAFSLYVAGFLAIYFPLLALM